MIYSWISNVDTESDLNIGVNFYTYAFYFATGKIAKTNNNNII